MDGGFNHVFKINVKKLGFETASYRPFDTMS